MNFGIEYRTTGNRERGRLTEYHRKPSALHLGKGAKQVDIAGLPKATMQRILTQQGGDFNSKFTIGFEVEKSAMDSSVFREYELFCGFERDGSCGYEAVTHILPLLPACQWRNKVFDLFVKAERVLDDSHSPSDSNCGGHITLSVEGMTGDELRVAIRKHSGIILSMFRNRLRNKYCGANRRMQGHLETSFHSMNSFQYESNGWHYKYQVALVKGDLLEFRLPSRVQSVKQVMRRYELMFHIVDFAINNPNGTHAALINRLMPTLKSMYNGQEEKLQKTIELSADFRQFILSGRVSDKISQFL